jgi:hypothetical protein
MELGRRFQCNRGVPGAGKQPASRTKARWFAQGPWGAVLQLPICCQSGCQPDTYLEVPQRIHTTAARGPASLQRTGAVQGLQRKERGETAVARPYQAAASCDGVCWLLGLK